ncbi:flagellar export chaperone FliS [Ruminococcaceae bacterium OttesenSCG-928-A11]|nr:flagellar export chaperone FliS [Ruminococcaceae bacterium OttesenSCG-928-A11]
MNPYEKYQQQMVTTMTQGEMLLLLYDEVLKQIDVAKAAMETKDVAAMDKAIAKAEKIIRYLRAQLDFRYPVSKDLSKLYDFFNTQLVMANVKKDPQHLNDIQPLIRELRETFDQCAKLDRQNRLGTKGNTAVAGPVGNVV